MAEEIKKTEELKKAEEAAAQDAQKLDDDALEDVAGGARDLDPRTGRPNGKYSVDRF